MSEPQQTDALCMEAAAHAIPGSISPGGNRAQAASGRLSKTSCIAYGCGDAACNVVYGMISTLLTIFYTDYVGVSVATVGLVMLISRVFDGTSDVIMGVITEKTKSRWGKCRPWMLWMAVPYGVTAVALFTVPQTSSTLQFWYIFVAYNLCTTVIYTAINVPYGALSTRMTRSSSERDMLSIVRLVLARCGQIVTVMLTMPLVKLLGNDQAAWVKAIGIWSVMAIALLVFCFAKCEEKVQVEELVKQSKVSLGRALKALVTNQYFWATLILWSMTCIHTQVIGTVLPYYCKYIFGSDDWMYSLLYVAEIGTLVVAAVFCPALLRRISKKKLTLAGALLAVAAQLLFLLRPEHYGWVVGTTVLRAVGEAPLYAVVFGMIGDTVEFGQWKHHIRQESLIFACGSMGFKVGTGVASAIVSGLLTYSGYLSSTGGGVVQPQSALTMIRNVYAFSPIIIWSLVALVLVFYRLDRKYPQIIAELSAREARGEM